MTRIRFEDLPSTNTPRNAENLNKLNNVVISPTTPTTGEEVWIDNTNKKIYTKNDNGVYDEFYNETNREVYSTTEQRIGTWIDGKPLYRRTFISTYLPAGQLSTLNLHVPNVDEVCSIEGMIHRKDLKISLTIGSKANEPEWISYFGDINPNYENGELAVDVYIGTMWNDTYFKKLKITIEYTKTTD